MKKLIAALLISFSLVGCETILNPLTPVNEVESKGQVLVKAAAVGFASYFSDGAKERYPETDDRVNYSIEQTDRFLAAFYPGKKYTVSSLIHNSEAFEYIQRSDLVLMIHILRIYLDEEGGLTGVSWLDALLQAQSASGISLDEAMATNNGVNSSD